MIICTSNFDLIIHFFSAATNADEIQEVLQLPIEVMTEFQNRMQMNLDIYGSKDWSLRWLHTLHYLDEGLRQLGYPTLPLTASKDAVMVFLNGLSEELAQYPGLSKYITPDSLELEALTDILTGNL